jgi:hypothetical protein
MTLIDGMIQTCRLPEFVAKVIEFYNEERKEKTLWEIWLYRVHDKSFSEFMSIVDSGNQETASAEEVAGIVDESISILEDFNPTAE